MGPGHLRTDASERRLRREVGLFGATLLGLGSMLGTGVFVSIGLAAGVAGEGVLAATLLAALLATANGLNSAQLAASHPVSGGTYEYGYRYLRPTLGFLAGWMFLCAKSASAGAAALGFSGYVLSAVGLPTERLLVPLALGAVVAIGAFAYAGLRLSDRLNRVVVGATLLSLLGFVVLGLHTLLRAEASNGEPLLPGSGAGEAAGMRGVLEATALLFVAYTGYGRVATLGEEVRDPSRTIPRAVIVALAVSFLVYLAVGTVSTRLVPGAELARLAREDASPLVGVAQRFSLPGGEALVAVGAVTAMLSVLLNLVLGLSRMLLAMARRGDLPPLLARLDPSATTPRAAVVTAAGTIAAIVLIGNIPAAWSLSAFTVLIYYATTNLAALALPAAARRYPPFVAWAGLAGCLFIATRVETRAWMLGLALAAVGLLWRALAQRLFRPRG